MLRYVLLAWISYLDILPRALVEIVPSYVLIDSPLSHMKSALEGIQNAQCKH